MTELEKNSKNHSLSSYFVPNFHKFVFGELFEDSIGLGRRNLAGLELGYHFAIDGENCEFYLEHVLIEVIDSRLIMYDVGMNWNG